MVVDGVAGLMTIFFGFLDESHSHSESNAFLGEKTEVLGIKIVK